jgi:hypothetical protein
MATTASLLDMQSKYLGAEVVVAPDIIPEDNLNKNDEKPKKKKKKKMKKPKCCKLPKCCDKCTADDSNKKRKKFGVWDGVVASCLLNIFGVIMFLRIPWIVGQAGIWQVREEKKEKKRKS